MATKLDLANYQHMYGRQPYWLSLLLGLDQLANVLLWGYVDETLSSRAYRSAQMAERPKKRWRLAEKVINSIFFWDRNGKVGHCELAYLGELARTQFPRPPNEKRAP